MVLDILREMTESRMLTFTLVVLVPYAWPFLTAPVIAIVRFLTAYCEAAQRRSTYRVDAGIGTGNRISHVLFDSEAYKEEEARLEERRTTEYVQVKTAVAAVESKMELCDRISFPSLDDHCTAAIWEQWRPHLNKQSLTSVFILTLMSVLLIVDTAIARQIFNSLGIFAGEASWNIHGFVIDYPLVYGLFMTIAVSFLLHFVWDRGKVRKFITHSRSAIIMGAGVLTMIFIIRLLTVIIENSDLIKNLMELVILICWTIGVFAVYWLAGEIMEQGGWWSLALPVGMPLFLVVLLGCLGLFVVQFIFQLVVKLVFSMWIFLRKTRVTRIERNIELGYSAAVSGFRRGLTLYVPASKPDGEI